MDNFSFEEYRDGFFSSDDAEQFNAVGDVIRGDPGPVFTPHVSREGILSWTNNGGLVNPEPVMIKGDKGDGTTFWFGTRDEYNALPSINPAVCYCIEEGT